MVSKFDEFKNSKEFKLWGNIKEVCDNLGLRSENDIISIEDLNEYWEPLLERIFKLGVCFKQTGKLKELKVDWLRPCFYIKTELEFTMDGKKYEPDKGSMQAAQKIAREFRYLIAFIQDSYDRLDPSTFKTIKTDFQKKSSEFFKALIPYATKEGYRYMKANVKEILRPLLDLRKANFHLFMLEAKEMGDAEVTLFQDRKSIKEFTNRIGEHFVNEEFKMKREVEMDKLEDFMVKNMSQVFYEYVHNGKKREDLPTVEAFRFRKEALQLKFEEGLEKMLKYLYDKKKEDFYEQIDVHKLFQNIDHLGNNELQCVKFYLDQQKIFLREMKVKLYEMKINGLTRCKMPITKNEDLIQIIKKLYDIHNTVDSLMGNKLKYDQFVFFYNCTKFLSESTIRDELITIKNRGFMEEAIPNYIILASMRQAAIILEKMRVKSYNHLGKTFKWDDYFQIEKMALDTDDDILINAFQMNDTMKKFFNNNPELKTTVDQLESEVKEFGGRFWILEGFFPVEDRKLWLEGIELLRNINSLVIDDIRDYLLTNYDDPMIKTTTNIDKKSTKNDSNTNLGLTKKESKVRGMVQVKPKSIKSGFNEKNSTRNRAASNSKDRRGNNKQSVNQTFDKSFDSEDDNLLNKARNPIKLDQLRPPYVWNFPIENYREEKPQDEEKKFEIRNVDPTNFYTDGRVKKFLDILFKIKQNLMNHCIMKKGEVWKFFFEKTIAIWNISYTFSNRKTLEKKFDSTNMLDENLII
jgi:hypothetical protein